VFLLKGEQVFLPTFLGRSTSMLRKAKFIGESAPANAAAKELGGVTGKGPFTPEDFVDLQTAYAAL
jgi:hypothetical protein